MSTFLMVCGEPGRLTALGCLRLQILEVWDLSHLSLHCSRVHIRLPSLPRAYMLRNLKQISSRPTRRIALNHVCSIWDLVLLR